MADSDSNSTSFSLDSGSDSADEGTQRWPVALLSSGASIEHYQEVHPSFSSTWAAPAAEHVSEQEQQLKHSHKRLQASSSDRVPSVLQLVSATSATPSASESTATSGTIPDSSKTSGVDKVILGLAKKYALTTEMPLPDKVIFQTDCPDPPVDFSSPACYAKKSTEKAALITELYTSIDYTLHAQI
ncbi:hypothetical protein BDR03DRAFT_1013695 [Suillus americanus]|nr:hypothetical protein BDR03DRAFT_1013695 [Suillus americanus]